MTALREERCLPAAVRGPVESVAFARFVRMRGSGVGDWGLGIGVGIGFVMEASSTVVAYVDGEFRGRVPDGVEGKGKIDGGVG